MHISRRNRFDISDTQTEEGQTMGTQHADFFVALAAPFAPHEIKFRDIAGGRQRAYITARSVMNRLDEVCGPESWWDEYVPGEHSVGCRLTIRLPDESLLTKCDAGAYAGMADQGDDDKSGYSDAIKRAAVKFGIGRFLYGDGVPAFVTERVGPCEAPTQDRGRSQGGDGAPRDNRWGGGQDRPQSQSSDRGQQQNTPRSGKALFAWTKDQEQRYDVGLLKYLNEWSKLQGFSGRMVEWDEEQVGLGYKEAMRKLASLSGPAADLREESYENAAPAAR